jgi:hypothetical protein
MSLLAWEFLKRWWREAGMVGLLAALVFFVPGYYSVSGALRACQEARAVPVTLTATAQTKVKIIYQPVPGKIQPCPDVEIDTAANAAAVDGRKTAPPKATPWPLRLDVGFDTQPKIWDNVSGEIGASFGPIRLYGRYGVNESAKIGLGYIHVFGGGAD